MKEYIKNLGKVVMTPKGAWSIEKEYEILDIVYDSITDHAYISKQEVPSGVDLSDSRYWMPLNVSGYSDSNVITLNGFNEDGEIQSYTLEEAIKTIKNVGRKSGAILIFYNDNVNRLDITTGCWEIWQFNSINVYDWENLDAWVNIYYNYNKFVGWYAAENILNKEIPYPDVGCYAFVGNIYNEAFVYRCDVKNRWTKTNQKAQHYIKVIFGDNVVIGDNGNWWQNGVDTNIPVSVKGDNGLTPYLRWSVNNQIEYSYDNVNWYSLSERFSTNIKIKDYVSSINELPNNVELGIVYGVGPTYAEDDINRTNPIYRIYVYTVNGWIDNGVFKGFSAGVVQEKGNSVTEVMSQDAITKELEICESKVSTGYSLIFKKDIENITTSITFKKGLTYCVKIKFDDIIGYGQIGTLNPNNTSEYINSSPIYYNVDKIDFVFTANEDSDKFMVYSNTSSEYTMEIKLLDATQKPTFNGLLNPETTTRGYVIQPIKSLYFFVEDKYLNYDIQIGALAYKDNKVQIHINASNGDVLMVYEETVESRPIGMKQYKGQYGYGGRTSYIDMWFDWDLYINELWLSNSTVKVHPYPIGGNLFNMLFNTVVTSDDPMFKYLVSTKIKYQYNGIAHNTPINIETKKGLKYTAKVFVEGVAQSFQVGTLLNSTTYIDSSSVFYNFTGEYIFDFVATEDSSLFMFYASGGVFINCEYIEHSNRIMNIEESIEELKQDINVQKGNSVCIASFDGNANEDMILTDWEKREGGFNNKDYYYINATSTPFAHAAKINKYFTISNKKIIWDIGVTNNTKVCAFTQGAGLENLYAQGYCVVADFYAKTFAIHKNYGSGEKGVSETLPDVLKSITFELDINDDSLFRIIMERIDRTLKASLIHLKTNTVIAEVQSIFEREIVPSSGLGYDIPALAPLNGPLSLYSARLIVPNAKPCFLYIVGDSITEGVPCEEKDCWAYKVAKMVSNTVVSGRGGGNIDGVLRKIQDEASVLKPTYVMVTIGTNGGNTPEKLSQLVNDIKTIGAIPIINTIYCSSTNIKESVNAEILALKEKCIRMDVATAINNNLSEGADASLFVSDGTHLNEQGNEKCYQQVLIDMPEIF